MIIWLETALVLAIHDRQLAEHGGIAGVRDEGLLESALARPRQLYAYGDPAPDLADLAATLACGLARNHPFVDGNKRTAAVACETFLELNGAALEAEDLELYPLYLALAEGKLGEREFAAWLRRRMRTRGRGERTSRGRRTKRRRLQRGLGAGRCARRGDLRSRTTGNRPGADQRASTLSGLTPKVC